MDYKQGDIVLVPFPLSDKPDKEKQRPAVIVSSAKSNSLDQDFLICPLTTTIRETPFSFVISDNHVTIPLPKNSEIRCNKIVTIRNFRIISKISELKAETLSEILVRVKQSFDYFPTAMFVEPKKKS